MIDCYLSAKLKMFLYSWYYRFGLYNLHKSGEFVVVIQEIKMWLQCSILAVKGRYSHIYKLSYRMVKSWKLP